MKAYRLLLAGAAVALGGFTRHDMEAPEAPPASMENVVLSGIASEISKGEFAVAGVRGSFERALPQDFARSGEGGAHFMAQGSGVDGTVSGDCRLDLGDFRPDDTSIDRKPFHYSCQFLKNGRQTHAKLELFERLTFRGERLGYISYGGKEVRIRSTHYKSRSTRPSFLPLGYTLSVDGQDIGSVDLSGKPGRTYIPRDPAYREAAIVASVALALFVDPGAQPGGGSHSR